LKLWTAFVIDDFQFTIYDLEKLRIAGQPISFTIYYPFDLAQDRFTIYYWQKISDSGAVEKVLIKFSKSKIDG